MRDIEQPIFATSVALVRSGEVLLIARGGQPYAGRWTLPGGRVEPGEPLEACAIREIGEELSLTISALRPVLVMTVSPQFPSRLAVFATDRFTGEPMPSDEVEDWRWMRPAEATSLPTTPRLAWVLGRAMALFDAR